MSSRTSKSRKVKKENLKMDGYQKRNKLRDGSRPKDPFLPSQPKSSSHHGHHHVIRYQSKKTNNCNYKMNRGNYSSSGPGRAMISGEEERTPMPMPMLEKYNVTEQEEFLNRIQIPKNQKHLHHTSNHTAVTSASTDVASGSYSPDDSNYYISKLPYSGENSSFDSYRFSHSPAIDLHQVRDAIMNDSDRYQHQDKFSQACVSTDVSLDSNYHSTLHGQPISNSISKLSNLQPYHSGIKPNQFPYQHQYHHRLQNRHSLTSQSTIYHDATETGYGYYCDHIDENGHYREAPSLSHSPRNRMSGRMPIFSPNLYSLRNMSPIPSSSSISAPFMTTPSKYDTLLKSDSLWDRLKSVIEKFQNGDHSKKGQGLGGGLFCNCTEGDKSPDSSEKDLYLLDGSQVPCVYGLGYRGAYHYRYENRSALGNGHGYPTHQYCSFKDTDQTKKSIGAKEALHSNESAITEEEEEESNEKAHLNDRTVKKDNSSRGFSLVNLGQAPNHHNRHESDMYWTVEDDSTFDTYNYKQFNEDLQFSPPEERNNTRQEQESSRKRLFTSPTPVTSIKSCESPESIEHSVESPASNQYPHGYDLDSYAGDTDTVGTGYGTAAYSRDSDFYDDNVHTVNPKIPPQPLKSTQKMCYSESLKSLRPPFSMKHANEKSPIISPTKTVGTTGTMHRRINSTCTFTAQSLAQIFGKENCSNQNFVSPTRTKSKANFIPPKTVKTVKKKNGREICDDISPLDADDHSFVGFQKNRMQEVDLAVDDDTACSPIHREERKSFDFKQNMVAVDLFGTDDESEREENMPKVEAGIMASTVTIGTNFIPWKWDEPEGSYLPHSNAFVDDSDESEGEINFEGWVAYSKQGSKDDLLDCILSKNKIKRKHLRYIIVRRDLMYVYPPKRLTEIGIDANPNSSKIANVERKKGVKVLKLKNHMSIEIRSISRQHGQCIVVRDSQLAAIRESTVDGSDIVCTMLPVRLSPKFFQDDSYSQVVDSAKFEKIRNTLFAFKPPSQPKEHRPILKDKNSKTPYPCTSNSSKPVSNEWPTSMMHGTVPIEQNTAALHMQFALNISKTWRDVHKIT